MFLRFLTSVVILISLHSFEVVLDLVEVLFTEVLPILEFDKSLLEPLPNLEFDKSLFEPLCEFDDLSLVEE